MKAWMVYDGYAPGGHYSVYSERPAAASMRETEMEVRTMEIPDEMWEKALNAELPRDEDESNDSSWEPYWDAEDAVVVWQR